VAEPARELRHVTVVEEAHRLLRRVEGTGSTSQSIELFANLLAEIRAYGEGLVVAEQIPSKVIPDLIKNTALKVVHRLPAADDRDAVGATMNLDRAQSEYVVTLTPGRAAVFVDGMDRPVLSAISYEGEELEHGTPRFDPPVGAARRHGTCGAACRGRACTLEEMRLAQELCDTLPGLRLWTELSFVCHIFGDPLSGPGEAWLATVRSLDPRRVECAVSQLAEAACEARYPYLRSFYRPEGLAEHVCAMVVGRVAGRGEAACASPELQWRAGTRRWVDVRRALASDTGDRSRPHPGTAEWARRGLVLPDGGRDEQLAAAQAHPWSWYPHQRDLELGGPLAACGLSRGLRALTGSASDKSLVAALKQLGLDMPNVVFNRLVGYARAADGGEGGP
jgi:hypothetical protein